MNQVFTEGKIIIIILVYESWKAQCKEIPCCFFCVKLGRGVKVVLKTGHSFYFWFCVNFRCIGKPIYSSTRSHGTCNLAAGLSLGDSTFNLERFKEILFKGLSVIWLLFSSCWSLPSNLFDVRVSESHNSYLIETCASK